VTPKPAEIVVDLGHVARRQVDEVDPLAVGSEPPSMHPRATAHVDHVSWGRSEVKPEVLVDNVGADTAAQRTEMELHRFDGHPPCAR
jgi:hypothetical protein